MLINEKNSTRIVDKIGEILHKNVNIMNAEGIIVASTDTSRIGTLHQAAKELIERNAHEIDVYSDDNLTGSREGVNVPIYFEGRTVGVIGVTGNPDALRDISLVIGEMASIFFMETSQTREKELERQRRRHYWENLLFNNHTVESKVFIQQGKDLGIYVQRIRSVAQLYMPDKLPEMRHLQAIDKLVALLHARLDAYGLLYHRQLAEKIMLFFGKPVSPLLLDQLNAALQNARDQLAVPLYCGISGGIKNYMQISGVYTQAEKALDVACSTCLEQVLQFESLSLEILLNNLPAETRRGYLKHIWKNANEEEAAQMMDFLATYFDCDGSLSRVAEALFVHKNTVQYRLHKIQELTGYDPRKINDAVVLGVSVRIRHLL